jgi:hypothetical protein
MQDFKKSVDEPTVSQLLTVLSLPEFVGLTLIVVIASSDLNS